MVLPRAHGGVSLILSGSFVRIQFFPVHTGVFLGVERRVDFNVFLPRAHGGVSKDRGFVGINKASSPCTRGCFSHTYRFQADSRFFPVHTGVFLPEEVYYINTLFLPRAHGGVSVFECAVRYGDGSSPCTRGCFYVQRIHQPYS